MLHSKLNGLLKRKKTTEEMHLGGEVSGSSPLSFSAGSTLSTWKAHASESVMRWLQRYSDKQESLVGVDITPACVRICQMMDEQGQWKLVHLDSLEVEGSAIEDIWNHSDRYSEALKALIARNHITTRHAALSIPVPSAIIRTVTLPLMTDEEIAQAIAVGSLWENFVQLPGELSDYSIFHEVMKRDAEANTMDLLFVAAKRSDIEHYASIITRAGLLPSIIDVRCFALNNAISINDESAVLSGQVVFLKFGPDENYVHIVDNGEPFLYDIYLSDQERDGIAGLADNEEFMKRYARQAKQIIATHEMKHRSGKVTHIYVVSQLPEIISFVQKLAAQLPEYQVSEYDFFHHIAIPSTDVGRVAAGTNRSAWAVALGLAVRKLDILNNLKDITSGDHVNLLPGTEQLRQALKIGLFARMGLVATSVIATCFLVGSFGTLYLKETSLEKKLSDLSSVEPTYTVRLSKATELNSLVKKLDSLDKIKNELPSNQKQVLDAYREIGMVIPYGVWLKEVKFTAPDRLDVTGHSLDDQNILQFIRSLGGGDVFAKVSLKTMIAGAEKDTAEIGYPLKMFTLQLKMNEQEKGV